MFEVIWLKGTSVKKKWVLTLLKFPTASEYWTETISPPLNALKFGIKYTKFRIDKLFFILSIMEHCYYEGDKNERRKTKYAHALILTFSHNSKPTFTSYVCYIMFSTIVSTSVHVFVFINFLKNLPSFSLLFFKRKCQTYLIGDSLFYLLKLKFFYHICLHCSLSYLLEFLYLQRYISNKYIFAHGV